MTALPDPDTIHSGQRGGLGGRRAIWRARAGDAVLDLRLRSRRTARRLDELAASCPERDVLVMSIYRPGNRIADIARVLAGGRHRTRVVLGSMGDAEPPVRELTAATAMAGGKFENLNALWRAAGEPVSDWTLVVDDDVVLGDRFLDRFVGLCEGFGLDIAQPAQRLESSSSWPVTRRRPGSLLRETRFVEIGPVTAFSRRAAEELLPFPPLRFGWGLDLYWSGLAEERGWRLGIADALPVRHAGAVGGTYSRDEALEEARRFLADRPYLRSAAAGETVATHRP